MKQIVLGLLFAFIATLGLPALAEDKTPDIVGSWQLTKLTVNGEEQEDEADGKQKLVFAKDGTAKGYDDGEVENEGWYEFADDGKLHLYEDRNGNGKLDEEDKKQSESFTVSLKGDVLTLENEVPIGEKKLKIVATLKRVD